MLRLTRISKLCAVALALCCLSPRVNAQRRTCAALEPVSLPLRLGRIPVQQAGNAVLFHAGMYIDADGAPNAYAPNNKGLDFTANAKTGDRFSSIVLNGDGRPLLQRSGRYKGFYISTTSMRQAGGSPSSPATYVNAARIPYFVLPPEFADQFHV